MVYLFVHTWYPLTQAVAVATRYGQVMQKYPDDESLGKTVIESAVKATEKGAHVLTIWECADDKLRECLLYAAKRMFMFGDIEGLTYNFETMLTLGEALSATGLSVE